jgi:hypothetical protein
LVAAALCLSCASQYPPKQEQRYTIIKDPEPVSNPGGVPPDKEAEIQLLLQQRDTTIRRCYQDVLNDTNNRKLQGSVKLVITVGTAGKADAVKVVGGTLGNNDVETCLIETIKTFDFPQLATAGDVQHEFQFRPAY